MLDYVARQKLGGIHLTYGVLKQFAIPTPEQVKERAASALVTKPLLLLQPDLFGADHRRDPVPLLAQRARVRAELDAAFFHLYGIERDDVDYIMETFPIVKRKDEKEYGEYRTKRLILEIYDEMARAMETGGPYQTRLHPPPGDPRAAHPA